MDTKFGFGKDEGGVVTKVTLSDLHDIFANAHHANNPEDEGDYPIDKYVADFSDRDDLSDTEKQVVHEMVADLNALVKKYRELDSRFHDNFDCQ